MKNKMITKITKVISLSLLVLVLFFNIIGVNMAYSSKPVQDDGSTGQRIVEIIEEAVRNFWEVVRLDRLFDILIDFFRGIWDWAYSVFREGLERGREIPIKE